MKDIGVAQYFPVASPGIEARFVILEQMQDLPAVRDIFCTQLEILGCRPDNKGKICFFSVYLSDTVFLTNSHPIRAYMSP